jgi:hypothetical protein
MRAGASLVGSVIGVKSHSAVHIVPLIDKTQRVEYALQCRSRPGEGDVVERTEPSGTLLVARLKKTKHQNLWIPAAEVSRVINELESLTANRPFHHGMMVTGHDPTIFEPQTP